MAARIDIDENGNEKLSNLVDDAEKKTVYNAFAESYKELVSANKEQEVIMTANDEILKKVY